MKKILIWARAAIATLSVVSCKDFLETNPTSSVSDNQVFTSIQGANAALNGCEGQIQVLRGDLTKGLDFKADMVVANLISQLVVMLSPDVAKCCKGRGLYISSGIIDGTEDRCREAIEKAGFRIIDHLHDDCWHAFAALKD